MQIDEKEIRPPTPREEKLFEEANRRFSQMSAARSNFENQWEEVSQLIDTGAAGSFTYGNSTSPGVKKTHQQIDASGMVALERFGAILDSLLTPRNMTWHTLTADDDYVMKDRATQLWFENTTRKLFKYRYTPTANFSAQNQGHYRSLGAYGTAGTFIDKFDSGPIPQVGLRYKNIPMGELFLTENHQGRIDGFVRWMRFTARQAYQKFPTTFPVQLKSALEKDSQEKFDFLHCVWPRDDYEPDLILMPQSRPYVSFYVSMTGKRVVGDEEGYFTFPLAGSRYMQAPNETYGRGPAIMVLPALKTLNQEKKIFLKSGHRAADPVLLTADDGLVGMNMRPGAFNAGAVNSDGRPLVHVLPTGNIQITEKMMAEEKMLINDLFLVNLFQILTETPTMTATEVIERTNEKGILLAPTVGRQQSEYLGTLIERELDVLSQERLLDPMPPRLREAQGNYSVVYTSPLSRMMRASEASGFWRTVEQATNLANITQDPSVLDPFDFEVAIPATAEINGTLPSWMAAPEKVAAKRQARAQQAQAQQQIAAAPAQAALMSAQAKQAQAGMTTETR